jgi:hypothetical protein
LYDIYFAKELFQQTEFILEKILRLERYIFGDQHVFVGHRFNELAQLHQIQGHTEKATHFYQKASQILQRPFGEEYPYFMFKPSIEK